jgi:2-phospho-L-lactate guanylyltransferase
VTWLAVIPLKGRGERKTRLAGRLDEVQRRRLSQALFEHVSKVLRASPAIAEVALLSDARPSDWEGGFFLDEGRGLNAELDLLAKAIGPRPLLVIHADLPLLSAEDIAVLLAEAEAGCAIACDREGRGTNAVALHDPSGFHFAFGPESFARHLAATKRRARVVRRLGLGLDIDTPDDLDAATALGFAPHR